MELKQVRPQYGNCSAKMRTRTKHTFRLVLLTNFIVSKRYKGFFQHLSSTSIIVKIALNTPKIPSSLETTQIYILLMYYILHKYYYYNLLYKSFPVSLPTRSLNQCSFWFFVAWGFNFFGTDFSCSGVGITGQILIVPLWDFSSQKWSLVF